MPWWRMRPMISCTPDMWMFLCLRRTEPAIQINSWYGIFVSSMRTCKWLKQFQEKRSLQFSLIVKDISWELQQILWRWLAEDWLEVLLLTQMCMYSKCYKLCQCFFSEQTNYTESSGHSIFNFDSCSMHKRRVNQFMINFRASVEVCHVYTWPHSSSLHSWWTWRKNLNSSSTLRFLLLITAPVSDCWSDCWDIINK